MIHVDIWIYNETPAKCCAILWEHPSNDCFICAIRNLSDGVDIQFQDLRLFKAFIEIKQLQVQNRNKEPVTIEEIDRFIKKYQPEALHQNDSADLAPSSPQ